MTEPLFVKIKTIPNWDKVGLLFDGDQSKLEREEYQELAKKMALTPETCKVIGLAVALGDGSIRSCVVGSNAENEAAILAGFWWYATAKNKAGIPEKRYLIGYNIAVYDLACLITRSMMLGVDNSNRGPLDFRAWGHDIKDMLKVRAEALPWGKESHKSLTWLSQAYDIPPTGEYGTTFLEHPHGSDIEALWLEDPAKIRVILENDVNTIREYYQLSAGYTHVKDW